MINEVYCYLLILTIFVDYLNDALVFVVELVLFNDEMALVLLAFG